jgi:hypothetical protein
VLFGFGTLGFTSFRLITADNVENVIVNAAHRLHQSKVPERMIGIQFVQIGDDEDATQALKELDTALEQKWNIRVWVIHDIFVPSID